MIHDFFTKFGEQHLYNYLAVPHDLENITNGLEQTLCLRRQVKFPIMTQHKVGQPLPKVSPKQQRRIKKKNEEHTYNLTFHNLIMKSLASNKKIPKMDYQTLILLKTTPQKILLKQSPILAFDIRTQILKNKIKITRLSLTIQTCVQ